ncbi:hypothetical protein MAR_023100 [Mya arenaria]|uniref:Reverse transcriptase n=1 Tax=Mya arenaria TaxID=6604 RepID=A0ABY7DM12_MYAAR|nr:hypothetical protein MAR_023100 [Mya arenaria]
MNSGDDEAARHSKLMTDELVKSLGKKRQHDLAVLDFSKAFDRVPHKRLLSKLHHYGIKGQTLN